MRTLVIGDIHGGLKGLTQLLSRIQPVVEDQLIFVGDYVDGWRDSAAVIQYLIALSKTQDCVFIKGNHDVWCEKWLRTKKAEPVWLEHGGEGTVESYASFLEEVKATHLQFFQQMKYYHVDQQNRLFVHAGFIIEP